MKDHLISALAEKGESLKVWNLDLKTDNIVYISWIEDNRSLFKVGFFNGDIGLDPFPEEFSDYPSAFERFSKILALDD